MNKFVLGEKKEEYCDIWSKQKREQKQIRHMHILLR